MPVLGVGFVDAVATDVEPHRRIEGRLLLQEQVRKLVVKDGRVIGGAEVAAGDAPVANGLSDAGDKLAHSGFALGRAHGAMQIFAGNNVGRRHRPVLGRLDIFLLKDDAAVGVGNLRQADFPLELVVRRDTRLGEIALKGEAGRALLWCGGCGGGRGGGGGNFGHVVLLIEWFAGLKARCISAVDSSVTPTQGFRLWS